MILIMISVSFYYYFDFSIKKVIKVVFEKKRVLFTIKMPIILFPVVYAKFYYAGIRRREA